MRRRVFLASVGAAAAGAAVGLRAGRAEASQASLVSFFQEARRTGKPMLVVTLMSREDHATFGQARDAIEHGSDRDLAVRLILVSLCESEDDDAVRLLTNEKARIGPPSLALVDGAPARLIKEAKLERGLGQFLRETVPLTAAWLGPRVAELSRHHREQVGDLRSLLAGGQLPGVLGQQFPAVVAQEALRRKGAARDRLLADLVAPWNAPPPPAPKPKPGETLDKCGLAMNLLTPLGLRFADAFTKPAPFGGSEEDA